MTGLDLTNLQIDATLTLDSQDVGLAESVHVGAQRRGPGENQGYNHVGAQRIGPGENQGYNDVGAQIRGPGEKQGYNGKVLATIGEDHKKGR